MDQAVLGCRTHRKIKECVPEVGLMMSRAGSPGSCIISAEGVIIIKLNEVSQVFPCSALTYEDGGRWQEIDLGLFCFVGVLMCSA